MPQHPSPQGRRANKRKANIIITGPEGPTEPEEDERVNGGVEREKLTWGDAGAALGGSVNPEGEGSVRRYGEC